MADLLSIRLEDLDRQIVLLKQLQTTVADLRDHAVGADPTACASGHVCRYL